jgi:hypothetical protein
MRRSSWAAVVALGCAFAWACETPPVSPSALAVPPPPPAHASPDPPPAKPVIVDEPEGGVADAAVEGVEGGVSEAGASAGAALPALENADDVIASLRPKFRTCYQQALADDPQQRGKVTLKATVSPQGDVLSVTATQVEATNNRVVGCVTDVLKAARFGAPGGRGATLQVPIVFRNL